MANESLRIDRSLSFRTLGSPPSSPITGEIYFDGANLLTWNGSSWVNLGSGGGGGSVIAFSTYLNANQTGVNTNNSYVQIHNDTVSFDTNTAFDTTNHWYVVPSSGYYVFSAATQTLATNVVSSITTVGLFINGTLVHNGPYQQTSISTQVEGQGACFAPVFCALSDQVEVRFYSNADNSINNLTLVGGSTTTWFGGYKLSAAAGMDTQYDLTVTGTNWTTLRAVGIPYTVTPFGGGTVYRFKFNITGSFSPGTASASLAITGVTFKNVSMYYQAITAWDVATSAQTQQGRVDPGANTITAVRSASSTDWIFAGDVELDSAPSL